MKQQIKSLNYWLSEKYAENFRPSSFVQTILLHKIYPLRKDVHAGNGTTSEGIDLSQFEYFIQYFTKRKIKFIDEDDIINGQLEPGKKYIYLTFDDGYFNNFLALDILKKYNAKATFYISTNHIAESKSFWWDVQFRERIKEGKNQAYISQEISDLYMMKWKEQEEYILRNFGEDKLKPLNDLDRPMNFQELERFSAHPSVRLGNHTHNHLNTTLYTKEELIDSLQITEKYLKKITAKPIKSISYPYGFYNEDVLKTMRQLKYEIGITVNNGVNSISEIRDQNHRLEINRTQLSGFHDIRTQLHNICYNFSLFNNIKTLTR